MPQAVADAVHSDVGVVHGSTAGLAPRKLDMC